jgi:uroporphyrin-III C-methyltransferase
MALFFLAFHYSFICITIKTRTMTNKERFPILITGTGPGNPELLTVKAYQAISSADVLLYDCMPAHYVLDIKREDAEIIYICKSHEFSENELRGHMINVIDTLEKNYNEGKKIVRLKSGDAFMYGGGGLEASLLKSRGIPFEIIPGLTAGAAAANLYGVKISEKDETDTVIYYIGCNITDNFYQLRQIARLLNIGATLVLYMADDNLSKIIKVLKEEGVPGAIPTVVVGMASLPSEDCASGTLDSITQETSKKEMLMPFTYFIGSHVKSTVESRTKMSVKPLKSYAEA